MLGTQCGYLILELQDHVLSWRQMFNRWATQASLNLPLRTTFAVSQRLCTVVFSFSFVSMYFLLYPLISWLTIHCLVTGYLIFMYLCSFQIFLWLISSFIVLWSERCMVWLQSFSICSDLFLWPNVQSILENIPCTLEKNVYSIVLGWDDLNIC